MTDWKEKLNLAASELESAREKRDDLIKETEAAIIRYQVEIETLFIQRFIVIYENNSWKSVWNNIIVYLSILFLVNTKKSW